MRFLRPVAVLALLLVALTPTRAAAAEDRFLAQPPQRRSPACERLIVALFDLTGSFTRWRPRAITHGQRVIARLEPGDCFVARPIGSESFQVETRLTVRVPRRLRPIDPPFERHVRALKAEWQRLLPERLAGRPAPITDLWGAIEAAGQTLTATAARERWLLVYSDLDDNVHRPHDAAAAPSLHEARVDVFFIPRTVAAARFRDRLRTWAEAFCQAGARVVQFYDTDLFALEVPR